MLPPLGTGTSANVDGGKIEEAPQTEVQACVQVPPTIDARPNISRDSEVQAQDVEIEKI